MKSYFKIIPLAAAVMMFVAADSFAAVDMFLHIKGKGVSKTVKLDCPKNGECTVSFDDVTAGKYTLTLCDQNGNALRLKVKEKGNRTKCMANFRLSVVSPRDVSTGQSSGKRMASTDTETATESEIVSPRDAASGLPTGKRQHKPITITKTLDKSSPELMGIADLDRDGRLDVVVAFKWSDGSTMGLDDWESPVN